MFLLLFVYLVLIGGTLAIVIVDRRWRRASPDYHTSRNEPQLFVVIMLTILMNLCTLPYYFGKTRGSARGFFVGFALFLACFIAASVAGGCGHVLDVRMGTV